MKLVFIYGAPAAGKLTVAEALARLTDYKLLDNHKLTDYLLEIFPRSKNTPLERIRSKLGRKLRLDVFEAVAEADINIITTFAPISPGMHDFMRRAAQIVESAGSQICFVHLRPRQEVMLQRVVGESRRGRKIETVARWHEALANNPLAFATFSDREHLVLDNSDLSPAKAAQQIKEYYHLP